MNTPASLRSELIAIRSESLIDIAGIATPRNFCHMAEQNPSDDPFPRKYESFENEPTEDFIRRHSRTKAELQETIDFLIRHRELVRDIELQKLESESQKLVKRLREIDQQKLEEELKCFKDVLGLQARLSGSDKEQSEEHVGFRGKGKLP